MLLGSESPLAIPEPLHLAREGLPPPSLRLQKTGPPHPLQFPWTTVLAPASDPIIFSFPRAALVIPKIPCWKLLTFQSRKVFVDGPNQRHLQLQRR